MWLARLVDTSHRVADTRSRLEKVAHLAYFIRELPMLGKTFKGQVSPQYPGGVTLRFARLARYRPDKRAADASTIADVRALLPAGSLGARG